MTVTTLGFLHTLPAFAANFDALVAAQRPQLRRVHTADAWLLATARREGVTAAVEDAVANHVRGLVAVGADAVLVTCSSIGEAVEAAAGQVPVPVLRVDAPMAARAVELATAPGASGRVAVLAALESTLGPTGRLVERAVRAAGARVEVGVTVVAGAAEAADAGDRARSDELVAAAVAALSDVDAIVLAQASMAAAAATAAGDVPVLSSPQSGVAAALAVLAER